MIGPFAGHAQGEEAQQRAPHGPKHGEGGLQHTGAHEGREEGQAHAEAPEEGAQQGAHEGRGEQLGRSARPTDGHQGLWPGEGFVTADTQKHTLKTALFFKLAPMNGTFESSVLEICFFAN